MSFQESSQGLPPPPPYSMTLSNDVYRQQSGGQQQQQYAPPPGPPPGFAPLIGNAQPAAAAASSYYNPPSQGSTLMNADPRDYVTTPNNNNATNPFTSPSDSRRPQPSAVSNIAAGRLSQDGQQNQSSGGTSRQRSVKENPLDLLKNYDSIFVIDDSASMNVNELPDGSIGQSRWEEARDALAGMVTLAARLDDDGVDIHFLNNERCLVGCRDAQQVKSLFDSIEPEGITPVGSKLSELLLQYLDDIEEYKTHKAGKQPKKRNYIILTDGSPTDDPESVIVAIASRLDRANFPLDQIGIQFIQVGNDEEARQALEELDDALSSTHQCRDIVDTVTYSNLAVNPEMITKALLGGINRRLDRQKERR